VTQLPNSEQELEWSVATEAEKKYNSRLPKHHFSDLDMPHNSV